MQLKPDHSWYYLDREDIYFLRAAPVAPTHAEVELEDGRVIECEVGEDLMSVMVPDEHFDSYSRIVGAR